MNNLLFNIRERLWKTKVWFKNGVIYGDFSFPKMITIEIQTQCNRKCFYCPNSVRPQPQGIMDEDTFNKVLSQLQYLDWSGKVVFSHLSEPTLDTRLVTFIAKVRAVAPKSQIVIYTNGDFLNEKLISDFILAGISYVSITKHPPSTPEWETRINNLLCCFPSYIQLRGEIFNARWLYNFNGVVPNTRYMESWLHGCPVLKWNMVIYYNGDIPLCTNLVDRNIILGNIKTEYILDIWNKPEFKSLRKQAHKVVPDLEVCMRCHDRRITYETERKGY